MATADRKLDVIIFGATGFTGKYTVLEAAKILTGMQWGVSGRNRAKLETMLTEMGRKANVDLSHIPIVLADVDDEQSLNQMASECRVVVNCCGPYWLYGEQVIKACLATGTHHVDVSGEQQFMEGMQLKYHEQANERGVYLISACGFNSIPADMGTVFLEQQFGGVVNSVETYLVRDRAPIHYGTWASGVHAFANIKELERIRKELYKTELPQSEPILKDRSKIHKSSLNKWSLPFPGSDMSCVQRTQRFLYELENKRPLQMKSYISFGNLLEVIGASTVIAIFWLLVKTVTGQKLLLNYPRLFSLGMVSHEGPSEEEMNRLKFSMYFEGRGWEQKLQAPNEKYTDPPSKILRTKVTGTNPAYGATCVSLLLSARTILREADKMPGSGGCFTAGSAFAKTSLISELCNNGFTFEVLPSDKP